MVVTSPVWHINPTKTIVIRKCSSNYSKWIWELPFCLSALILVGQHRCLAETNFSLVWRQLRISWIQSKLSNEKHPLARTCCTNEPRLKTHTLYPMKLATCSPVHIQYACMCYFCSHNCLHWALSRLTQFSSGLWNATALTEPSYYSRPSATKQSYRKNHLLYSHFVISGSLHYRQSISVRQSFSFSSDKQRTTKEGKVTRNT